MERAVASVLNAVDELTSAQRPFPFVLERPFSGPVENTIVLAEDAEAVVLFHTPVEDAPPLTHFCQITLFPSRILMVTLPDPGGRMH